MGGASLGTQWAVRDGGRPPRTHPSTTGWGRPPRYLPGTTPGTPPVPYYQGTVPGTPIPYYQGTVPGTPIPYYLCTTLRGVTTWVLPVYYATGVATWVLPGYTPSRTTVRYLGAPPHPVLLYATWVLPPSRTTTGYAPVPYYSWDRTAAPTAYYRPPGAGQAPSRTPLAVRASDQGRQEGGRCTLSSTPCTRVLPGCYPPHTDVGAERDQSGMSGKVASRPPATPRCYSVC